MVGGTTFGFFVKQSTLFVIFLLMNGLIGPVTSVGGTPSSFFFFAYAVAC